MNRLSFLFMLGVLAVLAVGALTGYLLLSKASMAKDLGRFDAQISNLENEVAGYKGEDFKAALSAKAAVGVVKQGYIEWSKVIEKILATTPKDKKTKLPLVEYTSYSGSQGSDIAMNVRTLPDSKAPFSDVAELLRAFSESDYFADPFVPSISTGFDEDGKLVLVFGFNVNLNNTQNAQ